jgi:CRP-like cAMP-binding protein
VDLVSLPFAARLGSRFARPDAKAALLASHALLAPLAARQQSIVASVVDIVWVAPGKLLARQGALPLETFVVARGWAHVLLDGVAVARIDERQTIGVAARHDRTPFGASVVAGSEMELYVIQPRSLRTFVELVPWAISEEWSDFAPWAAQREPTITPSP